MFKNKITFINFFLLIGFSLTLSVDFALGHGVSDSDKMEIVDGELIDYVYLGGKHMVTGYDHILFLIGVMFFLTKFSDIVKFITAFTIGHSLTLVFATLYEIDANYYLIDAVIAISVIYKGFENLGGFNKVFKINSPNLILMVFVFGLIHGFGLSSRLQQLPLGHNQLIAKIISFNLGVELGQVLVLSITFPLIAVFRKKTFDLISKLINSGLILAGVFLFVFQIHGFLKFPIEDETYDKAGKREKELESVIQSPSNQHSNEGTEHGHYHGDNGHHHNH